MKDKLIIWCAAVLLAIMLPYSITMLVTGVTGRESDPLKNINSNVKVIINDNGVSKEIDLEEYVLGVLATEISPKNSQEAISAQAVIVRTNVLKKINGFASINEADLEFDYMTEEELRELWGETDFNNNYSKIKKAVGDTIGIVMKSNGEYIDALYHEVSIGTTVSAKEIYDKDISYLIAAESTSDVESKDYMQVNLYTVAEINSIFQVNINKNSENLGENVKAIETTEHGFVKKISIGGVEFTGEQIKNILELNSEFFYIEVIDGKYRVVTLGKGHCMGLSQYGANIMAKNGDDYKTILQHFYCNVEITKFN